MPFYHPTISTKTLFPHATMVSFLLALIFRSASHCGSCPLSTASFSTVRQFLAPVIDPFFAINRRPRESFTSAPKFVEARSVDQFQRVCIRTGSKQNVIDAHERSSDIEKRPAERCTQRAPASLCPSMQSVRNSPALVNNTYNDSNNQLLRASLRDKTASPPRHMVFFSN